MESNKLTKDVTSEESGLLKNGENVIKDEAKASVAIKESTDNEASVEEVGSSPINSSESEPQPVPELVPEHVPELEPLVVPELMPEIAPEIVPETAPELIPETSPEILPESNLHNTLNTEPEDVTEVETQDIVSNQVIEDIASEKDVQEPASAEAIPLPVKEVSRTAETALIDQIVQVPVESDDDDDLFSDREPDANAIPIHDYSSYSKIQLINTLRKILAEGTVDEIRPHAEAIKGCFYKIRNTEIQEQKLAFTAEGNDEELFEPQADSFEAELKDLLREYKNLRAELNKKQEAVKEENYHKKLAIIEEIKSLINSEESINMTFQEFNNLQDKWKATGQVPQTRVKDLWENYHYHVELFYDFVKINRELRDLDLRRNMDEKAKLCVKAEELAAADDDALSTFRDL